MKKTADAIGKFGKSHPVACPHCGKEVNMQMLRSSNGVGIFNISVLNYKHDLFAICPECSALFGVDRKVSRIEARDTMNLYLDIPAESLTFQQVLPLKD
ncbi:MAG: zinc-ribbon domain-containing protein [Clostridia bacterium]|nr:zinc-ribbon domain-containing protein [Clostridia bacterium]MBQ8469328.1 zinc-ribbon domain-containing protein [Clostridia bacterium]MBR1704784.1 zinc-ribbon domain-containing protein [Clostridia bacterium]